MKLTASEFVPPAELRTGSGTIQMDIPRNLQPARDRTPQAHAREPAFNDVSVYLVNASQPRFATVQITRQKRNENQSAGEIEFTFNPVRPKIAESGARS